MIWPPTSEDFKQIALAAADTHSGACDVLVYCSNPQIMIFDPVFFARTDYMEQTWQVGDCRVCITIGKID